VVRHARFLRDKHQHRCIPFPLAARRAIKYDQILQLRHSMRGVIVIETVMRDSMLIRSGGYEGGRGSHGSFPARQSYFRPKR
jgi:hypothetical protein